MQFGFNSVCNRHRRRYYFLHKYLNLIVHLHGESKSELDGKFSLRHKELFSFICDLSED